MSSFIHFLLTRFNLPMIGRSLPDQDWLGHRFALFERFCLPSVQAQSCLNFQWLVFFHSGLNESFRARVESYRSCPRFAPVYVGSALGEDVLPRVLGGLAARFDHVITSRLDNDDALATRYIETVQACFDSQPFQFLNFTHGYQLSEQGAYRCRHGSNPFLSLIERAEGFRTVLGCGNHQLVSNLGPVRQLAKIPGWLQVVHDRNIRNRIRGIPVSNEELAPHFSIYPECLKYFATFGG